MTLKTLCTAFILSASASALAAAADGSYQVVSPDGSLRTSVVVGDGISYTVQKGETEIIAPSSISMTFDAGIVF